MLYAIGTELVNVRSARNRKPTPEQRQTAANARAAARLQKALEKIDATQYDRNAALVRRTPRAIEPIRQVA
jgi:hypothetical protein